MTLDPSSDMAPLLSEALVAHTYGALLSLDEPFEAEEDVADFGSLGVFVVAAPSAFV